jgi:hypothetical protein
MIIVGSIPFFVLPESCMKSEMLASGKSIQAHIKKQPKENYGI